MRPLDRLILGLLADGKARTGRALEKLAGGLLKRGTVYVRLARLEESGLVTTIHMRDLSFLVQPTYSTTSEPPTRILCYLTDAGKDYLTDAGKDTTR